jgi:hypothetical protein
VIVTVQTTATGLNRQQIGHAHDLWDWMTDFTLLKYSVENGTIWTFSRLGKARQATPDLKSGLISAHRG